MLFSLNLVDNTIIPCFFLFLLNIKLYLFIPVVVVHNFNSIAELEIPIVIPTKEAKEEMETHPVIVEIAISK